MALAKWYKVDFHTHTPASRCFEDKTITAEQWLTAAKGSGVNAVVITDHNSVEFISQIEAVKNNYEELNKFKVFYGIEICVSANLTHFLVIFDDKMQVNQIEDSIIRIGLNREDWGDTEKYITEDKLEDLYKACKEKIAIIPAHFAASKGLGKCNVNAIKNCSGKFKISAVEVRNGEDVTEYDNKVAAEAISRCARITGSDNPKDNDNGKHCVSGIGKMYPWVKMSSLDFNGLKQVFLDPEYRCKDYIVAQSLGEEYNPNDVTHSYVSGLNLENFRHIDSIDLRFSPYLNCIVGGRGTGKSTLIEAIRGALAGSEAFETNALLKKTMLSGGKTKVYYNFGDKSPFLIDVSKNSRQNYDYIVENNDGTVEGKIDFPADIFSQKEIFSLIESDNDIEMSNEAPLLKLIDERAKTLIYEVKNNISDSISSMLSLSQDLYSTRNKLNELSAIKAEIKILEASLNQFSESGLEIKKEKYYASLQTIKKMQTSIDITENFLNDFNAKVENTIANIDNVKFLEKETEEYPEIKAYNLAAIQSLNLIRKILEKKMIRLRSNKENFVKSKLFIDNAILKEDYENAVSELKVFGGLDFKSLQEELEIFKKREQELLNLKIKETDLIEKIKNQIDAYIGKRLAMSEIRRTTINENKTDNLIVEIESMSYKERLSQNIQKEFGKEGVFTSLFEELSGNIVEVEDNYANLRKYILFLLTNTEGKINEIMDFSTNDSRFLKIWTDKKEKNTLNSLINVLPEDKVKIKIIDNGAEISINDGSPGQKCAAILAFILSNGEKILIIDQPEDDLDNSLIYSLIVSSIRKMKMHRQIIIVTHNPNIPVLGDAEGIIILERDSNGKVSLRQSKKAGCIEEKVIRNGICEIMEGGTEAFHKREEKYMCNF